jgi:hypothetical protein
MVEKERDL